MRLFFPGFVNKIQSLRSEGVSYKSIAKILKVSPASVYKYSKHIQLTPIQAGLLKQNELVGIKLFVSRFAKEKDIVYPCLDENFANLLGHLFFDGSVFFCNGKYVLSYTNSSLDAIQNFCEKLHYCFNLKHGKIVKSKGVNVDLYMVEAYSKKAYFFLKSISVTFSTSKNARVPQLICDAGNLIKRSFLRTFWDDEGCIGNDGSLTGVSKSEEMIDGLVLLHKTLGVESHKNTVMGLNRAKIWSLYVARNKSNYLRFIDQIGFEHAIVTKGHNVGKPKKVVLLEKFKELYN